MSFINLANTAEKIELMKDLEEFQYKDNKDFSVNVKYQQLKEYLKIELESTKEIVLSYYGADSKLKDKVLYNTPVLSNYTSSLVNTVTDTVDLVNKSKDMDKDEFNLQVVKIMLDNKMTTKKYITNLKWQNKLDVPGLQELLDNYSE